jgi:FkbM family methyltransferase
MNTADSNLEASSRCLPLHVARVMASVLPRGKGASARLIGRLARRWIHHVFLTRHGALLPIAPEALDVYVSMMSQGNSWDYWVLRVLNNFLAPRGVLYDIGANVGYISVEIAHLRKHDDISVYAFEPQTALAAKISLAKTLNNLSNLTIDGYAIGSRDGYVTFHHMPHSVHATAVPGASGSTKSTQVPQKRIDTLASSSEFRPPTAIKIDVEGYEYEVIKGAAETIANYEPVIVFEISRMTDLLGVSPSDFTRLFSELAPYRFYSLRGQPIDLELFEIKRGGHVDVVALPDSTDASQIAGHHPALGSFGDRRACRLDEPAPMSVDRPGRSPRTREGSQPLRHPRSASATTLGSLRLVR